MPEGKSKNQLAIFFCCLYNTTISWRDGTARQA